MIEAALSEIILHLNQMHTYLFTPMTCTGGSPLTVTVGACMTEQKQMTAADISSLQEELDAPNSAMKTIRKVSKIKSLAHVTDGKTRPDTRPPVADGWAGADMRVFPLFDLITSRDGPTN